MDQRLARQEYLRTSGLPFSFQLEEIFPGHAKNSQVAGEFEASKQEGYWTAPFFSEVLSSLRSLQESGIRTAVSSNNGQEVVDRYLVRQGASDCFDLVLGYRPGFSKGKEHFEEVLRYFEVTPGEVLFVGDSLHDAQKATGFGFEFVGRVGTFSRGRFEREFPGVTVVEDLVGLEEVLCR
jgi:phosphoglycolate phosphatase-like HAD superfamily hydrolase